MRKSFTIPVECPVCTQKCDALELTICQTCGWVFLIYLEEPEEKILIALRNLVKAKKELFFSIQVAKEYVKNGEKEVYKLQDIHASQESRLKTLEEEKNNEINEKKAIEEKLGNLTSNEELEKKIAQLEIKFVELNTEFQQGNKNHLKSPNVAFSCRYDGKSNSVIASVENIYNTSKSVHREIVFAVAFFENMDVSFHQADLIIPTISKKIHFLEVGKDYAFSLKYQPPKILVKKNNYKIIHLIADTLSEYKII